MRYSLFIFITLVLFSCEKNETDPNVKENVQIKLLLGSGPFTCDEFCGSTIDIINGESNLKLESSLPDSITSKYDYWNREYIATIEFTEEICNCKDGDVDPGPSGQFPTNNLVVVKILKIREK